MLHVSSHVNQNISLPDIDTLEADFRMWIRPFTRYLLCVIYNVTGESESAKQTGFRLSDHLDITLAVYSEC